MGRTIALLAALVAGVLIAIAAERTPRPLPVSAPATQFSAIRAMVDVEAMARAAHPVGSPENRRVRDHLVARMAELGLSPEVRIGNGARVSRLAQGSVTGGRVENVVGVLPGRDRSLPALALMAHYDSVPNSPGAADDAAGTAAALEIVRAIKAGGPPLRDIMVVVTDGEEAGLLGANAFFQRDPLARRIGLVLNMETRGSSGRAQMFQTSSQNGELIDLFRRTAARPASSSLTVFIYEMMPNDTDLTETLAVGIPGLNYAFIGSQFDYHSPTSTPALLDKGSLQDLGTQVLSITRAAADAPALPGKAPSAVYSQVFGDLLIAYPAWAGWIVIAVAAGLLALAWRRAQRHAPLPWPDVARGAGALLFAVLTAVAVLQFARQATGVEAGYLEQRFLLAQAARWETALVLLGLGVLLLAAAELARGRRTAPLLPVLAALGAQVAGQGLDGVALVSGLAAGLIGMLVYTRWVSRPAAWAGVLLIAVILAIAAQVLAPPTAYIVAWPLLAASLAAAASDLGARRGPAALAVLAGVAALSLGWIGGLAHGAFQSLDLMALLGLPVLLAAFSLWPLAQPAEGAPPARWIGGLLLLAGLAVTAWVRFADPYTARHPQASYVAYQIDQDARRAWRFRLPGEPTAWSDQVLRADGGQIARLSHWSWRTPMDAAPAPFLERSAPDLTLAAAPGGARLQVLPPPGARVLTLRLRPDRPLRISALNGARIDLALEPGAWSNVRWANAEGGLLIDLSGPPGGALDVRYGLTYDAWPAEAKPLPGRPLDVMPFDTSDATFVTGSRRLTW